MTSSVRDLFELQETEIQIDQKKDSLAQLDAKLADRQTIDQAQSELEKVNAQINEIRQQQKDLELQAEGLRTRLKEAEGKLFSAGKGSKELVSLQQDEKQTTAQLAEKDDALLALMMQLDNARSALATKEEDLKKAQAAWTELNGILLADRQKLSGEVAQLEAKAGQMRPKVTAPLLAEWQAARAKKKGRIVAKVEQGRCQGCRLNLSLSELQKLKQGRDVRCSHCGRILFLG